MKNNIKKIFIYGIIFFNIIYGENVEELVLKSNESIKAEDNNISLKNNSSKNHLITPSKINFYILAKTIYFDKNTWFRVFTISNYFGFILSINMILWAFIEFVINNGQNMNNHRDTDKNSILYTFDSSTKTLIIVLWILLLAIHIIYIKYIFYHKYLLYKKSYFNISDNKNILLLLIIGLLYLMQFFNLNYKLFYSNLAIAEIIITITVIFLIYKIIIFLGFLFLKYIIIYNSDIKYSVNKIILKYCINKPFLKYCVNKLILKNLAQLLTNNPQLLESFKNQYKEINNIKLVWDKSIKKYNIQCFDKSNNIITLINDENKDLIKTNDENLTNNNLLNTNNSINEDNNFIVNNNLIENNTNNNFNNEQLNNNENNNENHLMDDDLSIKNLNNSPIQ